MSKYSFAEKVKTGYALVLTKLFYPKARLIRRPFYCRGKAFLRYGAGFTTGYGCRFDLGDALGAKGILLDIGENCKMGDYNHIVASEKVTIGKNCLMASKIFISDTSHGNYQNDLQDDPMAMAPDDRTLHTKPVLIGDNVWIGENVCILAGVTIGDGCIIGANCVVSKSVPAGSIVAGIPGKVIKSWDSELKRWESR